MKYVFFIVTTVSVIFLSGCSKCKDVNCLNGGQCNSGKCICQSGWTGNFCETPTSGGGGGGGTNNPACQTNNTATVNFNNSSSNPYYCYINGANRGTVSGNSSRDFTVSAGANALKAEQVSGYLLYPTVVNRSANPSACSTYNFNFP